MCSFDDLEEISHHHLKANCSGSGWMLNRHASLPASRGIIHCLLIDKLDKELQESANEESCGHRDSPPSRDPHHSS